MSNFTLAELENTIAERGRSGDENSWTARLFAGGMEKAAQKLGEEAVETVIASLGGERGKIVAESADLLYHWLVMLGIAGISVDEVMDELERRTGRTGVEEKAARAKS